jgi:hypothetical protein
MSPDQIATGKDARETGGETGNRCGDRRAPEFPEKKLPEKAIPEEAFSGKDVS